MRSDIYSLLVSGMRYFFVAAIVYILFRIVYHSVCEYNELRRGTGNTFSESTYALFFSNRAAPVRNISFRSAPFIVVLFKSISSMHSPLKGMRP